MSVVDHFLTIKTRPLEIVTIKELVILTSKVLSLCTLVKQS